MEETQGPQSRGAQAVQDLTGTMVGRFAIRARLGAGGMGEVYRADDTKLKRTVALKRIAPHLRDDEHYRHRLLKEAERTAPFTDPRIAGIYDVIEENGEIFLVMEYVEGTTLRSSLGDPFEIREFLNIAVQCAEALVAAHEKGLVHHDIKPENIMLTPAGQVKICDFGVAKRVRHPDDRTTVDLATRYAISGTPAYMAPEVLLVKESGNRADIFSLGVVFYEALTGQHPFRADSFMATMDRILHAEAVPPSQLNANVSPELERIVTKMLAKNPIDRYVAGTELLAELRNFQRTLNYPLIARPEPLDRVGRRRWVLVSTLAVLLVLIVGALVAVREPLLRWLSPIPSQKNLVVLPFRAIGGEPQSQAYCDGLTETLTVKLTRLTTRRALQVAPASEVRTRRVASVKEALGEFGANLVLEGTLYQSGGIVRVNYALIDATTLRQLDAETITGGASDPFAVQDRVVAGVAEMLGLELMGSERQALTSHGTQVAGAYDYYLQGRGYLQTYDNPTSIDNAVGVFERALTLDPNYALAYAGLGQAYWFKYEGSKDTQWVEVGRQACERALALDARLAAAHFCLGTLHNGTGQYERAVTAFQRALDIEPTSDDAYRGLAMAYERLGNLVEAERTYRRAISLRPHYWSGYSRLGAFYAGQARFQQAAEMFTQVVALAPDSVRGYSNLGGIYVRQGRYAEAIPIFQRAIAIRPTAPVYNNLAAAYFNTRRFSEAARTYEAAANLDQKNYTVWGNLAEAYYWVLGEQGKASTAYQKAIELAKEQLKVNSRDATLLGRLAKYHAMLGQREAALTYLKQALVLAPDDAELQFQAALVYNSFGEVDLALGWLERALSAGLSVAAVRDHPIFENLRADIRFQRLLGR